MIITDYSSADEVLADIVNEFRVDCQKIDISRTNCKSEIIELRNVTYSFNPINCVISYPSMVQPTTWAAGEILTEMLGLNPPIMENFTNNNVKSFMQTMHRGDGRHNYLYGERWHNSGAFQKILKRFEKDKYTRQALMNIYDATLDLNEAEWNVPCTIIHHMIIRPDFTGEDQLHMNVYMRSHDLFTGWRFDIMLNSYLLQAFAHWVGVKPGTLTFITGSLHVYEKDYDRFETLTDEVHLDARDYHSNQFMVPKLSFEDTYKQLHLVVRGIRALESDNEDYARMLISKLKLFYQKWLLAYINYYEKHCAKDE